MARGGGAEQELAVFNDERVARAVFGCPVPVVSAIGHETDVTLVDFVADLRAPTPSAAAELVAPDGAVLRELLGDLARRASNAVWRTVEDARYDLSLAHDRLLTHSPAADIARRRAELRAELRQGLTSLQQSLRLSREQLHGRSLQLEALSPSRTLRRGYAVCMLESGQVLQSTGQVAAGDGVEIQLADGSVATRVTVPGESSPATSSRSSSAKRPMALSGWRRSCEME